MRGSIGGSCGIIIYAPGPKRLSKRQKRKLENKGIKPHKRKSVKLEHPVLDAIALRKKHREEQGTIRKASNPL